MIEADDRHELTHHEDGSVTCSCGKAWALETETFRKAQRAAWIARHLRAAQRRGVERLENAEPLDGPPPWW